MGYICHHAIVVTTDYDQNRLEQLRDFALGLDCVVSPIVDSITNGYCSFCVFPDGSKEGWSRSGDGDDARSALISRIESHKYSDGSSPFSWAEIQYGDDHGDNKILRSSS